MTRVSRTPTTSSRSRRDATSDSNSAGGSSPFVAGLSVLAFKECSGGYNLPSCSSTPKFRGLTRVPKRITMLGFIVIFASGIGHLIRHPAGNSGESAQIVTSLVAGRATPQLVPESFEDELGYRPVWAEGTLVHPRGACSTPGGVGPDSFEAACRVHDFGYDLLRYAERRGTRIGPWARFDLDRHLYDDLLRVCDSGSCRATATLYYAAVTLNSIRQGYVAPTDEPTVPWAAAAVGVVGLAAAPIERLKWKRTTNDARSCRASGWRSLRDQTAPSVRSLVTSTLLTCSWSVAQAPVLRLLPWRGPGARPLNLAGNATWSPVGGTDTRGRPHCLQPGRRPRWLAGPH
jgi:hypothetical protein